MTTLDIVIVSYNARRDLERCLESLDAAPPGLAHTIVVVDNASPDDSVDTVRRRWPDVRLIRQERNLGFAAARYAGIWETRGDLVLLLHSDTIVPAGAIAVLAARLAARTSAAAAGPRLEDGDGRLELSFGRMLSPWAEVRQKVRMRRLARSPGPTPAWLAREAGHERVVDWVSGACLLVWRRDAEAVGLLDERYFLYTEDVDFCAALRARGREILFTPEATVRHLRGRSRATVAGGMNAEYRRSHLAFYEKHHPRWAPLLRVYLRLKGALPPARR
jgi:N-acetylglucosaminyl-diphospho-decaprenol L-rhamnosyltransferase